MQITYKLSPSGSNERPVLGELGPKITNYTVGQTPGGEFVYTIKFKFPRIGAQGESGFATLRVDSPIAGLLDWKPMGDGKDKIFRHVQTGAETPALQIAAKKLLVQVGGKPEGKNYYLCEITGFTSDAKIKSWGQYVCSPVKSLKSLTLADEDDETPANRSEDDIEI